MPATKKGYRVARLRRRRRTKAELWQAWVLYVLAAAVAFGAVFGAWQLGSRWLQKPEEPARGSYLALVTLTAPGSAEPVAAALVVKDAANDATALYVIPRDLLLEGPDGEYVFAGDAMAAGTLKQDLQRVVHAGIDAQYELPFAALGDLAAAGEFQLSLPDPVELDVAGTTRTFEDRAIVSASELPALFAASGPSGEDAAHMQEALWKAVLDAAALRPGDVRVAAARAAAARAKGSADRWYLGDALRRLTGGAAVAGRIPSYWRVAEGQFAFLPKVDDIMAQITRKAPDYRSRFTVVVRNGSGRVGAGLGVAERLAILDVNLPAPTNADTFDYRQTQILAGSRALPVAQDIRAILGRGVILDGADVPPDTVVVIVGADTEPTNAKPKEQP
ncbi:MAG: LytR C-terminal domain-containing protein [Actinobacteria bacterium]|nr:LytR C-terminal domain-containing protein [Actinomycetota bacterium]